MGRYLKWGAQQGQDLPTNATPKYAALIEEKVLSTLLAQGSEQGGAVSQKQGRKISDWASRFQDRECDVRVLPVGIEKNCTYNTFSSIGRLSSASSKKTGMVQEGLRELQTMDCTILVQLPRDMSINHRDVMHSKNWFTLVHNLHPYRANRSVRLIF